MKLTIDTEVCQKYGLSLGEALYLLALYHDQEVGHGTFIDVCKKGLLNYDGADDRRQPINVFITQEGADIIESILLKSEMPEDKGVDRFEVLADRLRSVFPEGKKEGTTQYWRDSTKLIAKRLKALVKKYKITYTDDEIVDAATRYVQAFNGNYRYMKLLKYFILKNEIKADEDGTSHIEETSPLLSFLDNAGQEDGIGDDWMLKLV